MDKFYDAISEIVTDSFGSTEARDKAMVINLVTEEEKNADNKDPEHGELQNSL